ncbi:MAG TPA: flavin reductase family protein [Pseudonocardiaceae bacterium]|jgi:flavin reductase (DIM6/NTAB) family NADH-FMN oxidoreductase RutF|nr:flavin reductase family protein [Pseudonocardiaceae bacterium]
MGEPRSRRIELRRCFGKFTTGVTIVTTRRSDGDPHGVTVNSFTSVSIDPPLILFSLDRRARSCEHFADGGFVVNILTEDQLGLARHFAGQSVPGLTVAWTELDGQPVIADCAAYLTCRPWAIHEGGDHLVYIGQIERAENCGLRPLVFHAGEFRSLGGRLGELSWDDTLDWSSGSGWSLRPR